MVKVYGHLTHLPTESFGIIYMVGSGWVLTFKSLIFSYFGLKSVTRKVAGTRDNPMAGVIIAVWEGYLIQD